MAMVLLDIFAASVRGPWLVMARVFIVLLFD